MPRGFGLLGALALVTALQTAAAGGPVSVELTTAAGQPLGRLTGEQEDRVTYFALDDIARLVGGVVRRGPAADRATVILRTKRLTVRRDRVAVGVDGREVTLSAPVRVRQGEWLVPGDVLVRALPGLLGAGVQVTVAAPAPPARIVQRAATPVSAPPRLPDAPPPLEGVLSPRARPGPSSAPGPSASRAAPDQPERPAPPVDERPRPATRAGPIELRHRSYPTYTRVVLEGDAARDPRLVDQRDGLVVALAGGRGTLPRTVRLVRDGLVAALELADARGAPALRVTFERAPAARKVYRLADPPRLVLDFYRETTPGRAPAEAAGIRTIVLDPGHGGHDPGAIGPSGLAEKELTLDLTRRVAALVQEESGVRVVLTRTRDAFVPLRERTALANRERGDLFVSIHVNAAPGMTASGTESYFLSSEATDNAARAAAAFENKVIALEAHAGGAARDVLRSILWDLAQSDFQQESSRLAEVLQNGLDRALRLASRGVKQAPFYVLGGAAMPAVLVEIGFISNPQEEQRLRDEGYRDRIARAIAAGIAAYKRDYDQRLGVVARP